MEVKCQNFTWDILEGPATLQETPSSSIVLPFALPLSDDQKAIFRGHAHQESHAGIVQERDGGTLKLLVILVRKPWETLIMPALRNWIHLNIIESNWICCFSWILPEQELILLQLPAAGAVARCLCFWLSHLCYMLKVRGPKAYRPFHSVRWRQQAPKALRNRSSRLTAAQATFSNLGLCWQLIGGNAVSSDQWQWRGGIAHLHEAKGPRSAWLSGHTTWVMIGLKPIAYQIWLKHIETKLQVQEHQPLWQRSLGRMSMSFCEIRCPRYFWQPHGPARPWTTCAFCALWLPTEKRRRPPRSSVSEAPRWSQGCGWLSWQRALIRLDQWSGGVTVSVVRCCKYNRSAWPGSVNIVQWFGCCF